MSDRIVFIPKAGACLATKSVLPGEGLVRWMVRGESNELALIGIWNLPVGSDLQLVRDEVGIRIVETPTGREIPAEELYSPPSSS